MPPTTTVPGKKYHWEKKTPSWHLVGKKRERIKEYPYIHDSHPRKNVKPSGDSGVRAPRLHHIVLAQITAGQNSAWLIWSFWRASACLLIVHRSPSLYRILVSAVDGLLEVAETCERVVVADAGPVISISTSAPPPSTAMAGTRCCRLAAYPISPPACVSACAYCCRSLAAPEACACRSSRLRFCRACEMRYMRREKRKTSTNAATKKAAISAATTMPKLLGSATVVVRYSFFFGKEKKREENETERGGEREDEVAGVRMRLMMSAPGRLEDVGWGGAVVGEEGAQIDLIVAQPRSANGLRSDGAQP